ncbi:PSP1 C-terminal conserved region containing protein [Novymonas esmeraldas]|uniref:PSP1 C-terminal conserved region containing protein n=1 Tax=Novymonas esmeraldas TaxID=1808958 RepID=A0AAW0F5H1_9TRYP
MPPPAAMHTQEREQLAGMVRKLMMDADEFFVQQQTSLQLSYAALNSRIDHLRRRVQEQQQLQQLSPMHSANVGYASMNPSPFSTVHSVPNADLLGVPHSGTGMLCSVSATPGAMSAMNATPLRPNPGGAARSLLSSLNGPSAAAAMNEALSENARANGGLASYLSQALNGGTAAAGAADAGTSRFHKDDAVTPPSKKLALSQPASQSPSTLHRPGSGGLGAVATVEDAINGDLFSTAPNRGGRSHHDSQMASPQAAQKLSAVELVDRFTMSSTQGTAAVPSNFHFDSLYEELTGGGSQEEAAQSPLDYADHLTNRFSIAQARHGQCSPCDRLHESGAGEPSPDASAISGASPGKNSIPVDSFRALHDQHVTTGVRVVYERGRPKVLKIPGGAPDTFDRLGIDPTSRCEVLVEFKRKRVLQFESREYVAPGSYVVVGGDRGEDLGLVLYVWCEVASDAAGTGAVERTASGARRRKVVGVQLKDSNLPRSMGVGNGTVLRLASDLDVQKLLGIQAELERRAIDVCAQLVLDHSLPMVIVDAEYQFDTKKLTFFYEAQQRMDFRELVRHLYKTFRARIWMELVDA